MQVAPLIQWNSGIQALSRGRPVHALLTIKKALRRFIPFAGPQKGLVKVDGTFA
jgi:hypothetical protein